MHRLPPIPDIEPTALERRLPAFNPHFETSLLVGGGILLALAVGIAAIISFPGGSPSGKAQPEPSRNASSYASWPMAPAVAFSTSPIVRTR